MSLRLPVNVRPGLRAFLLQAGTALPGRTIIAAMIAALLLASLAGCTTYTYEDGHKETVWGVPPVDEHKTEQERQNEGVKYREPGVIPEE
ncbi:MAG: hypothetical protein CME82_16785 [Halomonas sp.]|nr:hypothetical protein [Halomonas sp.]|tara:strand:+ start:330 stop:599 length:270 start_codon:yes stop_codon:yes gene_type:complete